MKGEWYGESTALTANDRILSLVTVKKDTLETEWTVLSGGNIKVEGNKITVTWEKK